MSAGGLSQEMKVTRQNHIVERLKKGPLNISDIAQYTGSSYHTARNDVRELMRSGYISPTGKMHEGASTYQAGHARPMPMVYHKTSNQSHPVNALGESYTRTIGETSSSRAALEVLEVAAELMYLVALSVSKGHPNHAPIKAHVQAVTRLRMRLSNAIVHLETITDIAQQMLDDERLWDVKKLDEISADPMFNPEKAILAHETIIASKE